MRSFNLTFGGYLTSTTPMLSIRSSFFILCRYYFKHVRTVWFIVIFWHHQRQKKNIVNISWLVLWMMIFFFFFLNKWINLVILPIKKINVSRTRMQYIIFLLKKQENKVDLIFKYFIKKYIFKYIKYLNLVLAIDLKCIVMLGRRKSAENFTFLSRLNKDTNFYVFQEKKFISTSLSHLAKKVMKDTNYRHCKV